MSVQEFAADLMTPIYRALSPAVPETIDEENRTVRAVLASETPVLEWDYMHGRMVPRVLLASGNNFPESQQVPLLDCHRRDSVESIIGSVREFQVTERGVEGLLRFASVSTAQWNMVREGHVTDVSVGVRLLEEIYIPEGEAEFIDGRTWEGPLNLATEWMCLEVSLCPIGADDEAKIRSWNEGIVRSANQGTFQRQQSSRFTDADVVELCHRELAEWARQQLEDVTEFERNYPDYDAGILEHMAGFIEDENEDDENDE